MDKRVVLAGVGAIGRATIQQAIVDGSIKSGRFPLSVLVDPAYVTANDQRPDPERLILHLTNCPQNPGLRRELQERITLNPAFSSRDEILLDGRSVPLIVRKKPSDYAYDLKDALVYDATGLAADNEAFTRAYLEAGAAKVFITALANHADATMVYGLNHRQVSIDARVISPLSCTTNAITFPLKVIHEKWGIVYGLVVTMLAYENYQQSPDGTYDDPRRGRHDAILNASISHAATAVGMVIPDLSGRLGGFSMRGRWPAGSVALLFLLTESKLETPELHAALREAAATKFDGRMAVNECKDYVLADVIGDSHASVVDIATHINSENNEGFTKIFDLLGAARRGKPVVVSVYYDNGWGTARSYLLGAQHIIETMK